MYRLATKRSDRIKKADRHQQQTSGIKTSKADFSLKYEHWTSKCLCWQRLFQSTVCSYRTANVVWSAITATAEPLDLRLSCRCLLSASIPTCPINLVMNRRLHALLHACIMNKRHSYTRSIWTSSFGRLPWLQRPSHKVVIIATEGVGQRCANSRASSTVTWRLVDAPRRCEHMHTPWLWIKQQEVQRFRNVVTHENVQ